MGLFKKRPLNPIPVSESIDFLGETFERGPEAQNPCPKPCMKRLRLNRGCLDVAELLFAKAHLLNQGS